MSYLSAKHRTGARKEKQEVDGLKAKGRNPTLQNALGDHILCIFMYYQILQLLQQLHNVKKVQLHIASAIIQEHTCIGTRKTCHIMSLSLQVL